MASWKLATGLFVVGYLIGSVVGYILYVQSPTFMWFGMFTLMPLVFLYLAYTYFHKTSARKLSGLSEAVKLTIYWAGLSFLLDAAIYIAVLPASFDVKPNWTFFVDQSPWIWIAYASIVAIVMSALWLHRRRLMLRHAA